MSTSNRPQDASFRQHAASTVNDTSESAQGKKTVGGSTGGGVGNDSSWTLDPAPPLRTRPLSKILAGFLTLAVVLSFSFYFAATVGFSMLLADLRKRRTGPRSGSGPSSSSAPLPLSPLLPDPETDRDAAVAAEPGIEGIEVSHEFIEVPVYPDEAEEGEHGGTATTPKTTTTTLHLARAGVDPSRRCVLFLHGFPECWLSWRRMMKPLVAAGYEVAALDMRGYNLSGKPGNKKGSLSKFLPFSSSSSLAAFDVGALAADARAAAVHLSGPTGRTVTLVSHDWGGAVAWHAASVDSSAARGEREGKEEKKTKPRRLRLFDSLVTMAIPHPLLFQANMGWQQAKRSWYVAFFQCPFFPEKMMAGENAASIRAMLPRSDEAEKKEAGEIADAFTRPGAATAAINYYRASVRAVGAGPLSRNGARAARALRGGVDVPVLCLYAGRDSALGVELLAGTERFCHAGVEIEVLDSGHWIQLEKSQECAEKTLKFLEKTGGNKAKLSD